MLLPAPFDLLPVTSCRTIAVEAGEVLFRQGEATGGVFFLVEGNIELRRVTENGDDVVLHRALIGETFAEASLFAPHYHCDAVSVAFSSVVEIRKSAVLECFASDSDFALTLTARFARQVQSYRRRFEIMAIRSAVDRVYAAISDGMLTGSVKSLASEIGLTHEVVYRVLTALVKQKRVRKIGRGQYCI